MIVVCLYPFVDIQRLLRAAQEGSDLEVRRLLQSHKLDVNSRHILGWTALHVAAMNGHSSVVKILLDAGADPNLGDEFTTVYHMAHKVKMHSLEGTLFD